jgi:hypothetical protein
MAHRSKGRLKTLVDIEDEGIERFGSGRKDGLPDPSGPIDTRSDELPLLILG